MTEMRIEKVCFYDTGLGREAGYANDAELIEAGKAQRARVKELLTLEAYERLELWEARAGRHFLNGEGEQ